jgi:hypothetical protein
MHAQKERNVYNFSLKLYTYVSKGTMPSQKKKKKKLSKVSKPKNVNIV